MLDDSDQFASAIRSKAISAALAARVDPFSPPPLAGKMIVAKTTDGATNRRGEGALQHATQ